MVANFVRVSVFLFSLFCACLSAQVSIDVAVQQRMLQAGKPVQAVIRIHHAKNEQVDQESFSYRGAALEATHMGDASHSSVSIINGKRTERSGVVSTYRVSLPAIDEGLHLIDPISVMVAGQRVESASETVRIDKGVEVRHFLLQAKKEPEEGTLYPGQMIRLGYKIYFIDHVELTIEELPLLGVEGLKIVGDKKVDVGMEGKFTVHSIAQDYEIPKEGTYSVPASVIEGYAYVEDFFGRRQYREPRLKASQPPMEIVVQPFPKEEKPPSFYGAVGQFSLKVKRLGSGPVRVGDRLEVEVEITADRKGNVNFPSLDRIEGISGNFRTSDLPAVKKEEGLITRFVIELRPLRKDLSSIPAIAWSYFDPDTVSYHTLLSKPIPIEVIDAPVEAVVEKDFKEQRQEELIVEQELKQSTSLQKPENEIPGVYPLSEKDFIISFWQTAQAIWLIPAFLALLFLQQLWIKRPKKKGVSSSAQLFVQAESFQDVRALSFAAKALEKKISEGVSQEEKLQITNFIQEMDEKRFTGGSLSNSDVASLLQDVKKIIYKKEKK